MSDIHRQFLYHEQNCPQGQIHELPGDMGIRNAALAELEKQGWVDTPAKFGMPKSKPEPEPEISMDETAEEPSKSAKSSKSSGKK